jgi:hypothetical protein
MGGRRTNGDGQQPLTRPHGRTGCRHHLEEQLVEHLIVVATILGIATFATGLLLPVLARRSDREAAEAALADELAASR